jgi:hypothetical protein
VKSQSSYPFFLFRPEVKENKEGADTEKAAEQSAEPEELVKEKVDVMKRYNLNGFNQLLYPFIGRRKNRRKQRKGSSSAVEWIFGNGFLLVKKYDLMKDRDCFFSFLFETVLGFLSLKYAKIMDN